MASARPPPPKKQRISCSSPARVTRFDASPSRAANRPNQDPCVAPSQDLVPQIVMAGNSQQQTIYAFSLNTITCNYCKQVVVGSIYQCQSFHVACAHCWKTVQKWCPCPGPVESSRNELLEQFVGTMYMTCGNAPHGCQEMVTLSSKKSHEARCSYTQLQCVMCNFTGAALSFGSHLADHHHLSVIEISDYNVDFGMRIRPHQGNRVLPIRVRRRGALFLIHLDHRGQDFQMYSTAVGPVPQEESIRIKLSITTGSDQVLSMMGAPRNFPKAKEAAVPPAVVLLVPQCWVLPDGSIQVDCCCIRSKRPS